MISMDKQYQTQDGGAVTLYCTDAQEPYPVHGRIEGAPMPQVWTAMGCHYSGIRRLSLIPTPDWREEIPWDALADWVQWVARDVDGWGAFERAPAAGPLCWYVPDESRYSGGLNVVRMPVGPDNWREAIAERPKGGA